MTLELHLGNPPAIPAPDCARLRSRISSRPWLAFLAGFCLTTSGLHAAKPVAQLKGVDFAGGAQALFGATHHGRPQVNYVYAQSTGTNASMTATFELNSKPAAKMDLLLEAMDDDAPGPCHIRILLNGREVFQGPSGFPNAHWQVRRFAIPANTLVRGVNRLSIHNLEAQGTKGMPPWFMVARCAVATPRYKLPVLVAPELKVRLPRKAEPIPASLPPGAAETGFKFRGTKGWLWTPEQYLEEIPTLRALKLNFLMNCYGSMFASSPGQPWRNEWWKPMTDARKEAFTRIIQACRDNGITFCFAFHPQIAAPRPLDPASAEDLENFYQHFAWAQSRGVRWFSVSLDDVSWGSGGPAKGGAAHAHLVNAVFGRLRANDPGAQLIFCPVPYWGDGTRPADRAYLEALGRDLHPEVYVYWTGEDVVGARITRRAAESYKRIVKHRLFLWDNYPVNDAAPTLHLGPVSGRDPDLCEVIDGYLSNPLASQNQMNRIPLATCADYAFNPRNYDPGRSIGQAILRLAPKRSQQRVLKDLVETYPGSLVTGGGTGANAVRTKFTGLLSQADPSTTPAKFVARIQQLLDEFDRQFPGQFAAAKKTIAADLDWMRRQLPRAGASS